MCIHMNTCPHVCVGSLLLKQIGEAFSPSLQRTHTSQHLLHASWNKRSVMNVWDLTDLWESPLQKSRSWLAEAHTSTNWRFSWNLHSVTTRPSSFLGMLSETQNNNTHCSHPGNAAKTLRRADRVQRGLNVSPGRGGVSGNSGQQEETGDQRTNGNEENSFPPSCTVNLEQWERGAAGPARRPRLYGGLIPGLASS